MKTSNLVPTGLLLLGLGTLLGAPVHGQSLSNGLVSAQFSQVGESFDLTSINRNGFSSPIDLEAGSGGWAVYLLERDTFALSTLKIIAPSSSGVTLQQVTLGSSPSGGQLITVQWLATGTFNGVAYTSPYSLQVRQHWVLDPGSEFLEVTTEAKILSPSNPKFFFFTISSPRIRVGSIDGGTQDQLLVPELGGWLLEDPVTTWPFGTFAPLLTVPILAMYGEGSGRCLYLTDDPSTNFVRYYTVGRHVQTSSMELSINHLPPDQFLNLDYTTPYAVRIGVSSGDWVDVAETYRGFLENETTWYQGPVGGSNPMPAKMKDLVAQVTLQPDVNQDNNDELMRDAMRFQRLFRGNVFFNFYGGWMPDRFDHFHFEGYLPGRPSFSGSIREIQKQFDSVAAPYVNSTEGVDHTLEDPAPSQVTSLMQGIKESFLLDAFGNEPPPLLQSRRLCEATTAWGGNPPASDGIFVDEAFEIAKLTRAEGFYLDVFSSNICYSSLHDHLPGGGTYLANRTMDRVRRLKQRVQQELSIDLGLAMERNQGRWSEEVHLMNVNVLGHSYPTGFVVPFFRFVHDNVKIGNNLPSSPTDPGQQSWRVALEVLTYGQLISLGTGTLEVADALNNRRSEAFYQFATSMADFLRGPFGAFHNGTAVRVPPDYSVANPGVFPALLPIGGTTPPPQNFPLIPPKDPQVVPVGMFRAVDGRLALAAANPWVGADADSFHVTATFDPAAYPGFLASPTDTYSVTLYEGQTPMTPQLVTNGQPFAVDLVLDPDAIVFWEFTAL